MVIDITCPKQKIGWNKFFISLILSNFFLLIVFLCFISVMALSNICLIISIIIILSIDFVVQIIVWNFDNLDEENAKKSDWKNPPPEILNIFGQIKKMIPECIKKFNFKLKTTIIEFFLFYHFLVIFNNIKEGWNFASDHREHNSNEKHDAIIVNIYSMLGREYIFQDGIKLLITFFIEKGINYKIYCCNNSQDFFEIVNNPYAKSLWIFGHGSRGSIRCRDQNLPYSELITKLDQNSRMKEYVYQFHCNGGGEKSLSDHLSGGRGFANYNTISKGGEIRGYIQNILNDDQWNTKYNL